MRSDNYYSIQEQRAHNRKERKEKELRAHWEDVLANDFSKSLWSIMFIIAAMVVSLFVLAFGG